MKNLVLILLVVSCGFSQNYWDNPKDRNYFVNYRNSHGKSEYLVKLFETLEIPKDASILEMGCNVGRNLRYLYNAGYHNLTGIDINKTAIDSTMCPEAYLIHGDLTKVMKKMPRFDVVFSMAVLQHIESIDWYKHIRYKTLILIEDEYQISPVHYPRKYDNYFENQILYRDKGLTGLNSNFRLRVFRGL